jgi:hypothetical protein
LAKMRSRERIEKFTTEALEGTEVRKPVKSSYSRHEHPNQNFFVVRAKQTTITASR